MKNKTYTTTLGSARLMMLVCGAAAALTQSAGAQVGPCPPCFDVEFSIDIGSDRELSDLTTPADNAMDPGDLYSWFAAYLPAPGDGSVLDDMFIFAGFDPAPDDDFAVVAPICAGGPIEPLAFEFFDLDGVDRIGLQLQQFVNPDGPNEQPIPRIDADLCIYDLRHLVISFDDDLGVNWLNCDVPTTAPSPAGVLYGTAGGDDEVLALDVAPVAGVVLSMTPWLDERELSANLAQTPFLPDKFDDDVDALDINAFSAADSCFHQYFTADHEAHHLDAAGGLLDPGSIYYVTPIGPVKVIDDVVHLGIPESTDVDGFEFVWSPFLPAGGPPGSFLAVVFSVDDDDPLTPPDESGGLIPGQLYVSYLMGFSVPMLLTPLPDDVDAIAAYCQNPAQLPPIKCEGDINGDGIVDVNDLNIVLSQWATSGTLGDIDANGVVDVNDLNAVLSDWGSICFC